MSAAEHPLIARYRAFSPGSEALAARARQVFPGGDTRASAHYGPYPLVMADASGCLMTDVDGNQIVDFMHNFTSLIHGHAQPDVVAAVQAQVARGSAYAAPSEDQIALAELICARVPSVEQLRFTSSGTEATLMALRCARAATGRQKIMKMEGGYHGSYELAEVSLVPFPEQRGPIEAPASTPVDASFPDSVLGETVVCPYNAPEAATRLIDDHADELAAVIVEPVLGSMGMVPATTEFLQALRTATSRHSIVLIFDEVITLRLDSGGAQAIHGVTPDLTCMGKIIGGGLPVGAVGGASDLMQLFSPDQSRPVMHASTFSGNALTMAAGRAAMENYTADEVARVNALGAALREGMNQVFAQAGVRGVALGQGSLTNLHLLGAAETTDGAGEIRDSRDAFAGMAVAGPIARLLHLGMLRRGILSATRLMYCTSTAMDRAAVDHALDALNETLAELRPVMEAERPVLLL
ncbi:MAG: aspartate aminotransferase family protein [Pseudomonadota bacterium]